MAKKTTDLDRNMMIRALLIGSLGVLVIIYSAAPARSGEQAETENAAAAVSDLLIVRPLAAAGSTLSTGLFVVALPFTYPVDGGSGALHTLVEIPWRFVANRPLGLWKTAKPLVQVTDQDMDARYSGILGRTFADTTPDRIR